MRFAYLAFFTKPSAPGSRIAEGDLEAAREAVAGLPGLDRGHFYTPARARDSYNSDEAGPYFGLQLYFDEVEDLEAAIAPGGGIHALARPGVLRGLEGAEASQQAMVVRRFPVDEEAPHAPGACSYVVHYPGPAADFNAWIAHYIAHHPPIMRRFPGIRQIEILTRMDWTDAMPWRRVHHMQRNRIMFDSPEALTAALSSPARHELRADFAVFPPFEGGNRHYPMRTELILPVDRREGGG